MVKMSYYTDYSNYTDWHDVDEDMTSVPIHGGNWNTWSMSEAAGMMCRQVCDDSNTSWILDSDLVASKYQHL